MITHNYIYTDNLLFIHEFYIDIIYNDIYAVHTLG
jgi:hypothetical protein